jgi:hypothetical protein
MTVPLRAQRLFGDPKDIDFQTYQRPLQRCHRPCADQALRVKPWSSSHLHTEAVLPTGRAIVDLVASHTWGTYRIPGQRHGSCRGHRREHKIQYAKGPQSNSERSKRSKVGKRQSCDGRGKSGQTNPLGPARSPIAEDP